MSQYHINDKTPPKISGGTIIYSDDLGQLSGFEDGVLFADKFNDMTSHGCYVSDKEEFKYMLIIEEEHESDVEEKFI